LVEKDENPQFASFAHALWWGFITLCTVGYGDAVPQTWKGKVIACFCALFGISFFALPAGILGSGFALKVQQQQRQKHMIRRRGPAATLIQSLWRCYASNEGHKSEATWKIYLQKAQRSPSSIKTNTSILTRMSTIRRPKTTSRSPARDMVKSKIKLSNLSSDNLSNSCDDSLANSQRNSEASIFMKRNSDVNFLLDEDEEASAITTLTKRHKGAIRAIRKLKYLVAKRKFKEALKPYDIKDVIESYSAGHSDLVFKVKGLQTRLDLILGRQGSKSKDVYDSKTSLASRIVNVERQVDSIDEKLQLFIEMYQEDRKKIFEHHERLLETPEPNWVKPETPCQIMCRKDNKVEMLDNGNDVQNEEIFGTLINVQSEDIFDTKTQALTPESEITLPTNTLSRSSTFTSMSPGLEIFTISDTKPSAVYNAINAYNV